jgi:acetate kinase
MSKVLVLNAGSSSLKYKLFSKTGARLVPLVSGLAERIGESAGKLTSKFAAEAKGPATPVVVEDQFKDHTVALKYVLNTLNNHFTPAFKGTL